MRYLVVNEVSGGLRGTSVRYQVIPAIRVTHLEQLAHLRSAQCAKPGKFQH